MVEATPSRPYTGYTDDLLRVERNMRLRRKRLLSVLEPYEIAPSVSTFPLLGAVEHVAQQTVPESKVGGDIAESKYISDAIINPHPRFGTLTRNIRSRRGEKVSIKVPLFHDTNTPEFAGAPPADCCGTSGNQVWSYGKHFDEGDDRVLVGCSQNSLDDVNPGAPVTLSKYLVKVEDPSQELKGLYYRSSPGIVVADTDWPRNGDVVVGMELADVPGWVRLQNGYYLPMSSEDGKIDYLFKMKRGTKSTNDGLDRIGPSPMLSAIKGNLKDVPSLSGTMDEEDDDDEDDSPCRPPLPPRSKNLSTDSLPSTLGDFVPAIHMDAMAFGMGCCCLQVTFQAKDVDESRFIYDQLAVLSPIFMALTASTPILRGRLADTDSRWGIISECVDDRTNSERGMVGQTDKDLEMAGKGIRRLYKSRYDSISTYIYQGACLPGKPCASPIQNRVLNKYNDIPVPIDEDHYLKLRSEGIDPALAQHVAHLFIRDPLVVFEGAVSEVDNETQTEHFESIQSTNWQSVRWKPPPPRLKPNDPHIGWRTEFRTMEMQLTDFENAAFTCFTVLCTRAILAFDLNLYLPLSRVDANMQRAHSRNAAQTSKFFFRRHLAPLEEGEDGFGVSFDPVHSEDAKKSSPCDGEEGDQSDDPYFNRRRMPCASGGADENSFEEMSMEEIMLGKGDYFPGLISVVYAYLDLIKCDSLTMERVEQYLELIKRRATGELVTPATWIREFVTGHAEYKQDSVVTEKIARDLMIACNDIGLGIRHEKSLLGDVVKIEPITPAGAYDTKLDSRRLQGNKSTLALLKKYVERSKVPRSSKK